MKSGYSFGALIVYALKPAKVGKWQLKSLCVKEHSIKTLYHVCQDGATLCAIMGEAMNLNRPGYQIQPAELRKTLMVTQTSVYETKTTPNGIKFMSGALAAEAMQSHRFLSCYLPLRPPVIHV